VIKITKLLNGRGICRGQFSHMPYHLYKYDYSSYKDKHLSLNSLKNILRSFLKMQNTQIHQRRIKSLLLFQGHSFPLILLNCKSWQLHLCQYSHQSSQLFCILKITFSSYALFHSLRMEWTLVKQNNLSMVKQQKKKKKVTIWILT
jgi:hypothetical protein